MESPRSLPGRPAAEMQAAADTAAPKADLRAQVSALARALEADPANLPDWIALGDALTGLREHETAAIAYGQAARLTPDNGESIPRRAESLTFAADGQVTPAARALFDMHASTPCVRAGTLRSLCAVALSMAHAHGARPMAAG